MARVRTKICGITRIEDARDAISAGADALGFVFHQDSPRYISPLEAREIISRLPPFPAKVGLFVNAGRDSISAALETAGLDAIQFHGDEEPGFCAAFRRPYIKAVRMKENTDVPEICGRYADAAALLLDSYVENVPGGSGISFDWSSIPGNLPAPIILAGGLTAANVRRAITALRPYAVDVSSGVEIEPGIKDKDKMSAFIREVLHD